MARIMSQGKKKFHGAETANPKIKPLIFATHVLLKKNTWMVYKVVIKNPLKCTVIIAKFGMVCKVWVGDIILGGKACFLLFICSLSNKNQV